jgi:hypothetical protein
MHPETQKNMQKFSIYIKSNKFYWSAEIKTYSFILFCCALMLVKQKILNIEENFIDKLFGWFAVCGFIFALILKLYNLNKIEPLRGKLEGFISFEKESITVGKEIYQIETIRNIKISNDDYIGKLVNFTKGNLGPALSNGINNSIIFFLESNQSRKYQFELIHSDDFQKVRHELINYHIYGKIEFDELANVLGEKSRSETAELKLEIENKAQSLTAVLS